jgi:cell division protein FtsI/penicillin-binding protein 2
MPKARQLRPSRHRKRVLAMQALVVVALGAVAVRIHYVQQSYGPNLLHQAAKVQNASEVLLAPRGALLDRNGHRLVYDVPAYMLDIRTDSFHDIPQLATKLSPILGKSADEIARLLGNGQRHWVRWPDPVFETDKQKILAAVGKDHAEDVTFTPTEQRVYPYGEFAANTLGYVTHDGVGAAGLEAEYNDILSGKNGRISFTRDNWGFPLQTTMHVDEPAEPGKDVQLTIDQTIQGIVETKMDELVNKYHPEHAAIIVTDPNTGEILAMASRPTFNPNKYWEGSPTALSNNWAVNEAFEPGSTFKALTLTAGLATGVISLDDTFMSGQMTVHGHSISDWNRVGWGRITFRQALEQSSNVGFATVALKLHWDNLLKYMKAFGFLDKTGIDLPAEASSIVFPPESRGDVQLATSGFGQGIAVTPIQMVQAYGAIANGGKLIRPHLVKAIVDPDTGKVLKSFDPVVVNPQVAPKDVIAQVNDTLVRDVSVGIDDKGKIPGYDVAGKTGTANIVNPKTSAYYPDRFNVSFIGYAPAEAPRFEVYVTLNWPKTAVWNQWGSTIATPAARDILQQCLQYAHIPPKSSGRAADAEHAQQQDVKPSTQYVQTPALVDEPVDAARAALTKLGLSADVVGSGSMVKSQWPQPGVEVAKGSRMYIWAPGDNGQSATMPNLIGTSMREAGNILAALGVNMQPKGYGFAVSQSVPPGQPIHKGQTVVVEFAPPEDPVQVALANQNQAAAPGTNRP